MKITARTTDTKRTERFVLPQQKNDPESEQIGWHLRTSLTSRERQHIRSMMAQDPLQAFKEAVQMCLVEIENFYYDDGEEVKIERAGKKSYGLFKPFTEETMDAIPEIVVDEIGTFVVNVVMDLGDEDVKN